MAANLSNFFVFNHYPLSFDFQVRPLFLGLNIAVMVVVLVLFLGLVTDGFGSGSGSDVVLAGSVVMALICTAAGASFLVYGLLLSRDLRRSSKMTSSSSSSALSIPEPEWKKTCKKMCCQTELALYEKITVAAAAIGSCFVVMSAMWVLSASDTEAEEGAKTAVYTALFLSVDILMLVR